MFNSDIIINETNTQKTIIPGEYNKAVSKKRVTVKKVDHRCVKRGATV